MKILPGNAGDDGGIDFSGTFLFSWITSGQILDIIYGSDYHCCLSLCFRYQIKKAGRIGMIVMSLVGIVILVGLMIICR